VENREKSIEKVKGRRRKVRKIKEKGLNKALLTLDI